MKEKETSSPSQARPEKPDTSTNHAKLLKSSDKAAVVFRSLDAPDIPVVRESDSKIELKIDVNNLNGASSDHEYQDATDGVTGQSFHTVVSPDNIEIVIDPPLDAAVETTAL